MDKKKNAVLFGPFVGEFYWECGRFAPMLSYMLYKQYKNKDVDYIVYTREERFDLYGKHADILVPLKIPGDYSEYRPECFRLPGFPKTEYNELAKKFRKKYEERYNIIKHVFPDVRKPAFLNKNQYPQSIMHYKYKPRKANYDLVDEFLPKDGKPLVVLAPRFRKGFKRNWNRWQDFYDLLGKDVGLMRKYNFVICGKDVEYKPDRQDRFLDMTKIQINGNASLAGILLVILEKAYFTFGSQSAIPNMSLLYGVEVLEFGCQKSLHTKTYNVKNTPITFIENKKYDLDPKRALNEMKQLLERKRRKENGKSSK